MKTNKTNSRTDSLTDSYLDSLLSRFENFTPRQLGDTTRKDFAPVRQTFVPAVTPWNSK